MRGTAPEPAIGMVAANALDRTNAAIHAAGATAWSVTIARIQAAFGSR